MRFKTVLRKFGIPVLVGAVILGGSIGFAVASSQKATQNPAKEQQQVEEESPNYKGSISLGQQDQDQNESKNEENEEQENKALAPKAKITGDEAIKAAETAYPDYSAKKVELENENGYLVYEVEMSNQSGKTLEVAVDAGNAKVLASESDSEQGED